LKEGNLVNLGYLRDATGDDDVLIREILELFLQDTKEELAKIQIAFNEDRCQEVARIAHRMKSSMLNLGLELVAQELLQIEKLIKSDGFCSHTKENVQRVMSICQDVFGDVETVLASE
jgi:HPt (histidine-containing phosphotransfer) domain-containing protein